MISNATPTHLKQSVLSESRKKEDLKGSATQQKFEDQMIQVESALKEIESLNQPASVNQK